MESLRKYLIATLLIVLAAVGVAHAQGTTLSARTLSLGSSPNNPVHFADLSNSAIVPQLNGTVAFCADCTVSTVCNASGSGALAVLLNGTWNCGNNTVTGSVPDPLSLNHLSATGSNPTLSGYDTISGPGGVSGLSVKPSLSSVYSVEGRLNAQAYGAIGDAIFSGDGTRVADGVASGATLTSATGNFTSALVGDAVFFDGAGSASGLYVGTVASYGSSTSLTVTPSFSTSVGSGGHYVIGFDNTTVLQAWLNAARTAAGSSQGPEIKLPLGKYLHRGLDFTEWAGLKLTGAGRTVTPSGAGEGGSMLLCISPTTSPKVCHDFSGSGEMTIRDLTFASGTSDPEAGLVNVLSARISSTFFGTLNTWENDVFRSFGGSTSYGVVLYGAEQTNFYNDLINANLDTAKSLYISAVNTPSFTSPTRGSLVASPTSMTIVNVIGAKSQISCNGTACVTLDNGTTPAAMQAIQFKGGYIRPINGGTGLVDTCTGGGCSNVTAGLKNIHFDGVDFEPQDVTSRGINVTAAALIWQISANAYYPTATGLTIPVFNFTNGFYSGVAQYDTTPPASGPSFSASSCLGSDIYNGSSSYALSSGCQSTLASEKNFAGVQQVNTGAVLLSTAPVGASNIVPTATFADGTHCGASGNVSSGSTTVQMQILMGSTNPTTECQLSFGTAAKCTTAETCWANDQSTFQALKAVPVSNTGFNIFAATDMHGDTISAGCVCL